MRRSLRAQAACLLFSGAAVAQPAATLTAPDDRPVLRVSARGVQVYECRAGAGGMPAWTFLEPRADLFVGDRLFGRHYAGPSWEAADGSRIVGKVDASVASPDPGAIPWLRLSVVSRAATDGALAAVTAVQRIDTVGGKLAGPCETVGSRSEVAYSADYVMLRATK